MIANRDALTQSESLATTVTRVARARRRTRAASQVDDPETAMVERVRVTARHLVDRAKLRVTSARRALVASAMIANRDALTQSESLATTATRDARAHRRTRAASQVDDPETAMLERVRVTARRLVDRATLRVTSARRALVASAMIANRDALTQSESLATTATRVARARRRTRAASQVDDPETAMLERVRATARRLVDRAKLRVTSAQRIVSVEGANGRVALRAMDATLSVATRSVPIAVPR